ncbi:hypothetical protein JCM9157_3200 [Halalkalibacter akibai JCM 9157]|uniref:Swarming motility protein SwrB n=2 Tax=Halalkalibacter akibai TaxID=1411 RepID=W4QV87_HALA3|nr:hypothetical protein JCM9157_3200 [Halalkalibacter akibai JCM 9157]
MMPTLLATISLLLHGITFLWIMTLLQKQSANHNQDLPKIKNEIEDLLIAYTAEMKEQNEKLIVELERRNEKSIKEVRLQQQKDRLKSVENKNDSEQEQHKQINEEEVADRTVSKPSARKSTNYEEYQPPEIESEDIQAGYEQSDTAKVIALSKQGESLENIAKKLGLGKGEVELMLKFYR